MKSRTGRIRGGRFEILANTPAPNFPRAIGEMMSDEATYRSAIKDFVGRPIPPEGDLRVWLDDDPVDREAPEGWVHVRSAREACFLLLSGRVVELSLDNDLNNNENENEFGSGFQAIDFLEEQHFVCGNPLWPRDGIAFHTANASAEKRMVRSVEAVGGREGVSYEVVRLDGQRARHLIHVEGQG